MANEVPVFNPGDKVKHKLGFDAVVHGVQRELRNEQGTVVQELSDEELIYLIGYMDNSGVLKLINVNYPVIEYVG